MSRNRLKRHLQILAKVREAFQNFTPSKMDELLERALKQVCDSLGYPRGALFFWNPAQRTLSARLLIEKGEILGGEEEIVVDSRSPLRPLLENKKDFLILGPPHYAAYLPLQAYGQSFGVLRVDNALVHKPIPKEDASLLCDVTRELSLTLRGLELSAISQEQLRRMKALADISTAIFRSLRLDEMLSSVARSLIDHLGFDRVKIYLLNKEGDALEAALTMDQRQRSEGLTQERHPLAGGAHPAVDLLLGKKHEQVVEKYQNRVLYLPLRTRDESTGVLMVDNLLSQQEISQEDAALLSSVGGQLSMAIKNARLFQGVEELSITDGLTGLYLLRYFRQRLREESYRAERAHSQLSLLILDIDHFKRYNDTYGHPAGDAILSAVGERVLANARKVDITARYGGDEFLMLLPDTDPEEARLLAQRLHQAIQAGPVVLADHLALHLTVSIGIAAYPAHAMTAEELLKRADEALYWAKSHGRNRISLYASQMIAAKPKESDHTKK